MVLRYKRAAAVATAATAATFPVLFTGTAASAATNSPAVPPPPAHFVTWQNTESGTYLEVQHAGLANNDKIDVYKKNGSCGDHGVTNTNCNEEWAQVSMGATHNGYGEFAYVNANSGLCLGGGSGGAGADVIQYSCGNYPTTRRYIYPNDDLGPTSYYYDYTLENVANNLYACKEAGGALVEFYQGVTVTSAYLYPSIGIGCDWK